MTRFIRIIFVRLISIWIIDNRCICIKRSINSTISIMIWTCIWSFSHPSPTINVALSANRTCQTLKIVLQIRLTRFVQQVLPNRIVIIVIRCFLLVKLLWIWFKQWICTRRMMENTASTEHGCWINYGFLLQMETACWTIVVFIIFSTCYNTAVIIVSWTGIISTVLFA